MKKLLVLPVVAFALVLSACIPSYHNSVTKESAELILRQSRGGQQPTCKSIRQWDSKASNGRPSVSNEWSCTVPKATGTFKVVTHAFYGEWKGEGEFIDVATSSAPKNNLHCKVRLNDGKISGSPYFCFRV
jgi:hypothetical protein